MILNKMILPRILYRRYHFTTRDYFRSIPATTTSVLGRFKATLFRSPSLKFGPRHETAFLLEAGCCCSPTHRCRSRMLTAASRRAALATAACLCIPPPSPASVVTTLKLPLQMQAGGVLTTGVVIDGEPFRLIVDSGSPYLVVPLDDCDRQPPKLSAYGCADAGRFPLAAFDATDEQYGAVPGRMQWLRGGVSFGETETLPRRTGGRVGGELVFGGADRAVLSQSGGALLGLIRQVSYAPYSTIKAADLRPTALGQLRLASFRIDAPRRELTLSSAPLIA
jgi:hypothetical protein